MLVLLVKGAAALQGYIILLLVVWNLAAGARELACWYCCMVSLQGAVL